MKKLAVVISASLTMVAGSALADPYVGLKAGYSWLDDECIAGLSCDDNDSASGGIFAGYDFNDFIALEGGWDFLGKFTAAGLNDDSVDAFTLAPKLSMGLTDALDVYGKLGGAYVNYGDENDASFLGALGLEYDIMENGAIRLEYQALTDINNDIVRAFANTTTLGFVYKFGGSEPAPVPVVVEEEMVEEVVVEEPVVMTKTFTTSLLDTETFALNSSELKAESAAKLDEFVKLLNEFPQATVEVVGHTDSSGAAAYNQTLSEKRAQAVADALANQGIDPARISVRGEGEDNPVASNSTREGRAQNRRVDVTIPEFEYQVQQ
ncbi:OmpA family protein [Vibrio sp. LaRot3]|uniref:OmpA family protein n=1 Tax=Vibrio sp. LaRot3 TaxID=2998829 RepID=UPI0022CE0036|nr:OmpA family protein [Vibrio sp. LaRot3]MDA0146939.1 OmpA family protein [Vibrio sp. LaRot3]